MLLVSADSRSSYSDTLTRIQSKLSTFNLDLTAVDLNQIVDKNINFLNSLWSVVMFLPSFALVAASLCLISYLMLAIDEQRQEFGVLRATGAKIKTIITILAVQSLMILLSSFGVGVSLGTIICILVL